jgi:apolipoprotein N-acyltransferase
VQHTGVQLEKVQMDSRLRGNDRISAFIETEHTTMKNMQSPKETPSKFSWGKGLLFAIISGVLLPLAYPTYNLFPLVFLAMVPLFPMIEQGNKKQAFLLAWVAGILTNYLGYSFLTITLTRFGGLSDTLGFVGHILLASYQGLRHGLFALFVNMARRKGWPLWASVVVVMISLEFLIPFLFTFHLGNAVYLWVPYMQIAEIGGVYLISAALLLANVFFYELYLLVAEGKTTLHHVKTVDVTAQVPPNKKKFLLALAGIQLGVIGYGYVRVAQVNATAAASAPMQIGFIQPNFGIDDKGKERFKETQYSDQITMSQKLEQERPDLIVWPETSYPYAFEDNAEAAAAKLAQYPIHEGYTTPVLFGAVTILRDEQYHADFSEAKGKFEAAKDAHNTAKKSGGDTNATKQAMDDAKKAYNEVRPIVYNSAWLTTVDGKIQGPYHKNFLVWFSEVLPFSEVFPFIDKWFPNGSNFARGSESVLFSFNLKGTEYQIAPNICNDDIMPAMTSRLAGKPANLMLNITNDAWFGNTSEPHFHLALATLRSVENRLYMLRATNTGISALIDATGKIVDQTPVTLDTDTRISKVWEVKMMPTVETIYRQIGNIFAYFCIAFTLIILVVRRNKS